MNLKDDQLGARRLIREVEARCFAKCSFYSEEAVSGESLSALGYCNAIENETSGTKQPDLIYYRPFRDKKEMFALLYEVKSGHINEDDLKKQAKKYGAMNALAVNASFKKHAQFYPELKEFSSFDVTDFSVVFQYYDEALAQAKTSGNKTLNGLEKLVTILSCKKGDVIKKFSGVDIHDKETEYLFQKGIKIPLIPALDGELPEENQNDEYIAYSIAQHAINEMVNGKPVVVSVKTICDECFFKRPLPIKVQKVLDALNDKKFCVKKRMPSDDDPDWLLQEYEFTDPILLKKNVIQPLLNSDELKIEDLIGKDGHASFSFR